MASWPWNPLEGLDHGRRLYAERTRSKRDTTRRVLRIIGKFWARRTVEMCCSNCSACVRRKVLLLVHMIREARSPCAKSFQWHIEMLADLHPYSDSDTVWLRETSSASMDLPSKSWINQPFTEQVVTWVSSSSATFSMSIAPWRRFPEWTTQRPFTCLYLK